MNPCITGSFCAGLTLIAAVCGGMLSAQVYVDAEVWENGYHEDFGALPASGSSGWVDNVTIAGWYSTEASIAAISGGGAATPAPGLYSLGAARNPDRALGATPTVSRSIAIALRLVNNTNETIRSFDIGYIIRQFRRGDPSNRIKLSYRHGASGEISLADESGWIGRHEVVYDNGLSGTSILDPDVSRSRSAAIGPLSWKPGEELWLRWTFHKSANTGASFGVDDFSAGNFRRLEKGPVRELDEGGVVGEAIDATKVAIYTPSIVRLDSGRLVASYTHSYRPTPEESDKTRTVILTSDDGGDTWQERKRITGNEWRLFTAGGRLYATRRLRFMRSDNEGVTWSAASPALREGSWFQTAANIWKARGNIYLTMETRIEQNISGWTPGEAALVLMRAPEDADLTDPSVWTFADEIAFCNVLEGYKRNEPETGYFGIPYFRQSYPGQTVLVPGRKMDPMGWGESAVMQILDAKHPLYDPDGKTFHLFARAHTGGAGYANLVKVVENGDGTMSTMLEKSPTGSDILFIPLPGGHMRFHMIYDEQSRTYWLLSTQATDSMRKVSLLPANRYGLPNNERNRMVLYFSEDLLHWRFAGLVAKADSAKESRHYACMDIDGDDLVILSRSGDAQALSAHNGNLATFHRVNNFRELIY